MENFLNKIKTSLGGNIPPIQLRTNMSYEFQKTLEEHVKTLQNPNYELSISELQDIYEFKYILDNGIKVKIWLYIGENDFTGQTGNITIFNCEFI